MKRIVYFLLIAALLPMLALQACTGDAGREPSKQKALIPPVVADETSNFPLAGAAKNSGASTTCTTVDDSSAAAFATEVIQLVNQERAAAGLGAVTAQDQVTQAAQSHSVDMGCNSFMSHTGSDGSTPGDRMIAAGYNYTTAAENVAAGYMTPEEVMDAWMASSGHRANILNGSYTKIGIGYVYNPNDPEYFYDYWTMNLGAP